MAVVYLKFGQCERFSFGLNNKRGCLRFAQPRVRFASSGLFLLLISLNIVHELISRYSTQFINIWSQQ